MASLPPNIDSDGLEYAWGLATLHPPQGAWTEEQYLTLTDGTNRLIELVNGRLEFPSMPTHIHQCLLRYLFLALYQFVSDRDLGDVHFTGLRLKTVPGNIREPDLLFLAKENYDRRDNRAWRSADLALEVVSPSAEDRQRDLEEKLVEYAQAGIAEYWIVDYQERVVIVNTLPDGKDKYTEHGRFTDGDQATSMLLEGFAVDVAKLFKAADELA